MSVTSVYPNVTPYVGNPAVDLARRENIRREIIEPITAPDRNGAEKGAISEDKSRNGHTAASTYADELKNRGTELKQAIDGQHSQHEGGNRQGASDDSSSQRDHTGSDPNTVEQTAEQAEISDLKRRDAEVRLHEQAHVSVGGQYASSPTFVFETGPDGKQYVSNGEVRIDISPIPGDPRATITKMQQIRAAALAPAEPSSADRRVAAEASRQIVQAQQELASKYSQITPKLDVSAAAHKSNLQDSDPQKSDPQNSGPQDRAVSQGQLLQGGVNQDPQFTPRTDVMQQRIEVISNYYAHSTLPNERPLLLTA